MKRTLEDVTIVAMGPSGYGYTESLWNHKKLGEVWGINHASLWYPGIDLAIHMDDLERDKTIDAVYVKELRDSRLPVLTSKSYWPECIEYPLFEVSNMIWRGSKIVPPLDNTIAFALAFAIWRGVKRLNLFGLDFCQADRPEVLAYARNAWKERFPDTEIPEWFLYHERSIVKRRCASEPGSVSTAFLAGYAVAKGIKIRLPPFTTFLDNDRIYRIHGYQDEPPVRPLRID